MFQSNKVNLIISIVAAIAIWVYVVTIVNPEDTRTIQDIQVELTNVEALAEDGLTVAPSQSFTIDLIVTGSRSEVNRLIDNKSVDIKATANMIGHTLGEGLVQVHVDPLPNRIEIVEIRPQQINVTVEELVSVTKPVRLTYDGKFDDDIEPGFITITPQEIEVSGTRAMVDDVTYVSAIIDPDDLDDYEKTINTNLVAMNETDEPVYDVTLSQDTVDVTATLLNVKEVPFKVEIEGTPAGENIPVNTEMPETIFIRGSEQDIAEINSVTASAINISSLDKSTIFIPDLKLPNGVQLASQSLNLQVVVEIDGIIATSVSYAAKQFEIIGLPDGYTAHVNTGSIMANVFGEESVIDSFKERDLVPYVDLNGVNLAESSVDLPVMFRNIEEFSRVESIPPTVRVNINKNTNVEAETANNE